MILLKIDIKIWQHNRLNYNSLNQGLLGKFSATKTTLSLFWSSIHFSLILRTRWNSIMWLQRAKLFLSFLLGGIFLLFWFWIKMRSWPPFLCKDKSWFSILKLSRKKLFPSTYHPTHKRFKCLTSKSRICSALNICQKKSVKVYLIKRDK